MEGFFRSYKKQVLDFIDFKLDSEGRITNSNYFPGLINKPFVDVVEDEQKETYLKHINKSKDNESSALELRLKLDDKHPTIYQLIISKYLNCFHIIAINTQALLDMEDEVENLRRWAHYDELTELLNRRGFWLLTENLITRAARNNLEVGIIYFDIDSLKNINTKFGHSGGDFAIKDVGERIKLLTRKSDILARIGGDEFVIVFEIDPSNDFTVETMCKRFFDSSQNLTEKQSTLSIGGHLVTRERIAELSKSTTFIHDLKVEMAIADEYSSLAKANGKNQFVTDEMYRELMQAKID